MKVVFLMQLLQLIVFLCALECKLITHRQDQATDECKIDEALLNVRVTGTALLARQINVEYQLTECHKCDFLPLLSLELNTSQQARVPIDSYYDYKFQVKSVEPSASVCSSFVYKEFGECGEYELVIDANINSCSIVNTKKPVNSYVCLYIVCAIAVALVVGSNLLERFWPNLNDLWKRTCVNKKKDDDDTDAEMTDVQTEAKEVTVVTKKKRLASLDCFRGISLLLMIFVNYGSGNYRELGHVAWHGIALADFLFPWFLWIMGISISLSLNSLLKNDKTTRVAIFWKITERTIKLFVIGFILGTRFGVYLDKVRIFGVLQRIALAYFPAATIELLLYQKYSVDSSKKDLKYYLGDLIWSWKSMCVHAAIVIVWFLITYLLPVPGCPIGYIGPGGLEDGGKHFNCTGGATGYIDRILFTENHLFGYPTCRHVYKTTQAFDPEGLLGTLNSIFLVSLGIQAGKILALYKNPMHHVYKWGAWSLGSLVLFFIFNIFVPINKNLWTPTYSLVISASSFFALAFLYFVIDIKDWWNGNPFIYPGMNSIIVYVCHSLFSSTFPVQWLVHNTHCSQVFMDFWGIVFWTLFAAYLFYKKIFINL